MNAATASLLTAFSVATITIWLNDVFDSDGFRTYVYPQRDCTVSGARMIGEDFTFEVDDSQLRVESDAKRVWFAVPIWDETDFRAEVSFSDCDLAKSEAYTYVQGAGYYLYVEGNSINVVRRH